MSSNFKEILQKKEFPKLKDAHNVLLKWATGCGKSKMSIDLVNNAASHIDKRVVKVLFVVAERAHINNWQGEFDKWHLNTNKIATTVLCYASWHKVKDDEFDIIVLDEAHHAFTPKKLEILENMKYQYIYFLSATLSNNKVDIIKSMCGTPSTSSVTLQEAIDGGVLADPKVYVVNLELDNTKIDQKIEIGKPDKNSPVVQWYDRNKYKFRNIPYTILCTQKQKYTYFTNEIEYWGNRFKISHNSFHNNKQVNFGSQRKKFMGELKTEYIRQLISILPEKTRYVCFCASVDQALSLSSTNTISSRKSAKYNTAIIDSFNNKEIDRIYAVGMITEGMNLTDIRAGIITQLDGKERLFIQKFGRSMRAEDPISFIFYYKDTQDEKYLNSALENIDSKFINRISINELNTIKL